MNQPNYRILDANSDEAKRINLQMQIGEAAKKAGARQPELVAATVMKNSKNVEDGSKAIEHLKEKRPDLFHGESHEPASVDKAKLTHEEYRKLRRENPAALGLRPGGSRR